MADSETTVEETEAAEESGADGADATSPQEDNMVDAIVDEVRGHFDAARDRLDESSNAFLEWVETTKSRLESEVEAQKAARRSAETAAEEAAAEAAASAAASSTASEPGVSTATLRRSVEQLDGADSQAELLSRLLEQSCQFAGRAALLLGGQQADGAAATPVQLEVWNAYGFDVAEGSGLKGRSLDRPAAWANVLAAEETVAFSGEEATLLAQALGCSQPTSAVAIPFILRDSAYAVLYADNGNPEAADDGAAAPSFDIDALQLISFIAAQSMECLNLRSVRPAATITTPTEVGAADTEAATPTGEAADAPEQSEPSEQQDSQSGLAAAAAGLGGAALAGAALASATLGGATDKDDDSPDASTQESDTPSEPALSPPPAQADTVPERAIADPPDANTVEEARVFADQLSAPVHYESPAITDPADATVEDAPITDADAFASESSGDDASAPSVPAPASEWSLTAEGDVDSGPAQINQADETHAPAPSTDDANFATVDATDSLSSTSAEGETNEAPTDRSESEAPAPTFVSVVEENLPLQPPPPPESPFATQVVQTGVPPLPPLDLSEGAVPEEPSAPVDPPSGADLLTDLPAAESPAPSGSGAFDAITPQSEVRPPRPLAFDALDSATPDVTPEAALETAAAEATEAAAQVPIESPAASFTPATPAATPAETTPASPFVAPPSAPSTPVAPEPPPGPGSPQAPAEPAAPAVVEPPSAITPPPSTEVTSSSTAEVTPPRGPSKTNPGSAQVTPPTDLTGPGIAFNRATPEGEDPRLDEARRLARLLVSELKLYNEDEIARGKRLGNIYQSLREDIDRSRRIYDERVDPQIRQSGDFLRDELVQGLANGDSSLLGM